MLGLEAIAGKTKLSPEDRWFYGFFVVSALATTLSLAIVKYNPPRAVEHPPKAMRVSLRVAPAAPPAPKEIPIPVKTPILPEKVEKEKPKTADKPDVQPTQQELTPSTTPEIISSVATLDAPSMPEAPPPPPDDDRPPPSAYADKPYGNAVVLAIKVDSEGNAVDVVIEVPSFNSMGDLTFSLAAKKVRYTDINPPIPPGSTIWVEKRIEYTDPLKNQLP